MGLDGPADCRSNESKGPVSDRWYSLEPEANLLTLIAIDDLATDLENATIDCRLRMELSFGVQREQSADEHNVDANDIVPVDFSPPDSEYELDPEEDYHYIGSDHDI